MGAGIWAATSARTDHRKPLRERVMFGGNVDLAILSGPLALPGLTAGKAVLVAGFYAIAGVGGLRVILFAAPRRFCLIATVASWECVLWPARTIGRRVTVA